MGAAGINTNFEQRELSIARSQLLFDFITCNGFAASRAASCHAGTANDVTANAGSNDSLGLLHPPMNQSNVGLPHFAPGKLAGETAVGLIIFGDDDQAAGVFVETMDNAGAERVDERAAVARGLSGSGAGVDHHASGLIDDGQVRVFEDYVKRDVFRYGP